jgi:indole-3-glycerol phosphate synthase
MQKFIDAKKGEIRRLEEHRESLMKAHCSYGTRPGYRAALEAGRASRGLGLVCEYKRASPSLGDIELGIGPKAAALAFARADCISVLTEERHFKGSIGFLFEMGPLPLLRKDFIMHPLQVEATARTPASAILLIVRLLKGGGALEELFRLSASLGLEPVVEVFSVAELDIARSAGAKLIQVNARDLSTLKVDFSECLRLIEARPPEEGELWIAASGVRDAVDLRLLRKAGYGAALVGTALMAGGRPKEALDKMLSGLDP